MKTANELFYASQMRSKAERLTAIASDAVTAANAAGDAYCTCKGDASEVRAAFEKYQALSLLQGEAERLAYDAQVRSFYANR